MESKAKGRRKERRTTARADAQLSMRVEGAPDDGALTQIVAESRNISSSGVYCTSSHYLAPLSKVGLTIVLPTIPRKRRSQRLLKCEGVVVRCQSASGARRARNYELACSFLGLDDRFRAVLDEFVTWRNLQSLRAAARPRSTAAPRRRPTTTAAAKRSARRRTTARASRTIH